MYHIEQHFRFTFFKYYYFIFFLNVYSLTTSRVLCRRAVLVYLRGPGKCEEAVLWWLLLWHLLRSLLLYHHFVSSPPNTIYLPVSLHSKYILEKIFTLLTNSVSFKTTKDTFQISGHFTRLSERFDSEQKRSGNRDSTVCSRSYILPTLCHLWVNDLVSVVWFALLNKLLNIIYIITCL